MKKILLTSFLAVTLLLTSCEGHKKESGTILGGVTGALIGSQFGKGGGQIAAVALGTLAGAAIGNSIGSSMDEQDKALYNRTSLNTLETAPTGTTSTWKNPDNGHWGTFTPTKTVQQGGSFCREFTHKINVGGKVERGYGTACRQPDGSWKIVN